MKKLGLLALAVILVVAFTMPAAAIETQFGGYWRTRAWTAQNFTGEDQTEDCDVSAVDTRTRLYFTTIFHENLKFVNKFEFDATWGSPAGSRAAGAATNRGYGQVSADGANIEIKNSYADFNLGPVNAKVGVQGVALARGFIVDDDFSGAVITYKGEGFSLPFLWLKVNEGGTGKDANDNDVDYFGIAPSFKLGDVKINPYVIYAYSENMGSISIAPGGKAPVSYAGEELNMFYAGLDVDANLGPAKIWFTGIYQGGDMDKAASDDSYDFSAYLVDLGAKVGMDWGDVHGEVFYASGDDKVDDDIDTYFVPAGQSHYWAEIMGYGKFSDTSYYTITTSNFHADQIGDILAANIGVNVKPMEKLNVALDVWYAAYAEDISYGSKEDDYIGTEVDLCITYQLVKGLNLDVVGAYLFAGDALTKDNPDDANPYEIGTRLSLSF